MSGRAGGEFWQWLRIAWDRPAGAAAVFVLGALIYWPLPTAFESYARARAVPAGDIYPVVAWNGFADGTRELLPMIQAFAVAVMLGAAVAGAMHVRRRAGGLPSPQPARAARSRRRRPDRRRMR